MSLLSRLTLLVLVAGACACACSSEAAGAGAGSGAADAADAPVTFVLDGEPVDVSDTLVVAEDGAKVIRNTVDVGGTKRLDIAPGLGMGDKSCAEASISVFDPADSTDDLRTDDDDPSCVIHVTSNGESNLFAGSFEGDLVRADGAGRHRVSVTWNARP